MSFPLPEQNERPDFEVTVREASEIVHAAWEALETVTSLDQDYPHRS